MAVMVTVAAEARRAAAELLGFAMTGSLRRCSGSG